MACASRTIVITGGAGFLGSNLAVHLNRAFPGTEVVALDNLRRRGSEIILERLDAEGVRFVHGDVRCLEDLDDLPGCDVLLECSAEPSVLSGYGSGPRRVVRTNLLGTLNGLEYARRCGAKVIFFSTSRVYPIHVLNRARYTESVTRFEWGEEQDVPGLSGSGVSESCPLEGARSFYGMTKLASERLLEEYGYAFGTRFIINRCGLLAGPWQMGKADQGVMAYWAMRHLFGLPLTYIGFGGAGKQVRDFLHVDDLALLVCEEIERFNAFEGRTFNVGGGRERSFSLCELTTLCREVTGNEVPVACDPTTRPADVRIYLSDCRRLFSVTDWRPRRTARETVEDIVRWAREHSRVLRRVMAQATTVQVDHISKGDCR